MPSLLITISGHLESVFLVQEGDTIKMEISFININVPDEKVTSPETVTSQTISSK